MSLSEAVEQAVDHCIRNGILREFLSENRAEAIAMSIFEYDEEKHLKSEREQAYRSGKKDGIEEGIKEGIREGEIRLARLLQILVAEKKEDDIRRVIMDPGYRDQPYREKQLQQRKID